MKKFLTATSVLCMSAATAMAGGLGEVAPTSDRTFDLVTGCETFLVPGTNYYNFVDPTCPRSHPVMEDHDEDEPVREEQNIPYDPCQGRSSERIAC